jgi:hypothetical protein
MLDGVFHVKRENGAKWVVSRETGHHRMSHRWPGKRPSRGQARLSRQQKQYFARFEMIRTVAIRRWFAPFPAAQSKNARWDGRVEPNALAQPHRASFTRRLFPKEQSRRNCLRGSHPAAEQCRQTIAVRKGTAHFHRQEDRDTPRSPTSMASVTERAGLPSAALALHVAARRLDIRKMPSSGRSTNWYSKNHRTNGGGHRSRNWSDSRMSDRSLSGSRMSDRSLSGSRTSGRNRRNRSHIPSRSSTGAANRPKPSRPTRSLPSATPPA